MRDIVGRGCRANALTAAVVAGLGLLAGLAGCGSNAAAPSDAGDGGAVVEPDVGDDFDAAPDWAPPVCPAATGEVLNAACNDQSAAGPCVDQIQVDDNAPGPEGGTIVAGTYDLVDRSGYTSPGGASGPLGQPTQETLVLAGDGASFTLSRAVLAAGTTTRDSATVSVTAAQLKLTVTPTCPADDGGAGAPTAYYYTAADNTLTLYRIAASGPVQASTYMRR
jgi:hypothetical protein